MQLHSRVVVIEREQMYGVGRIADVLANGRLEVEFACEYTEIPYTEEFDPHELELLAVWACGVPISDPWPSEEIAAG